MGICFAASYSVVPFLFFLSSLINVTYLFKYFFFGVFPLSAGSFIDSWFSVPVLELNVSDTVRLDAYHKLQFWFIFRKCLNNPCYKESLPLNIFSRNKDILSHFS